ncbi:MAG: helix-turn-helix domain-containing protein [Leptonema illini]|uniref:Helix-turn-helix domain-containing protein n=1 Tax=Leptonema illini TaxID=183 RepID=A0A833H1I9_9LEPT|nr:MAG: helix-turn-helix domain-containing protein [Leptonema illini]
MKASRTSIFLLMLLSIGCQEQSIFPKVRMLADPTGMATVEMVAASDRWEPSSADVTPGFTGSTLWFHISIDADSDRYLLVQSAMANLLPEMLICHYIESADGVKEEWSCSKSGFAISHEQKGYVSPFGYSPFSGEAYVRIRSSESINLSFRILDRAQFERLSFQHAAIVFSWIGIWILSLIISLFLFYTFRDRIYLSYALYLIPLAGIYAGGYIFAYELLQPEKAGVFLILKRMFAPLAAAFYLDMLRRFFELPVLNHRWNRYFLYYEWLLVLLAPASFLIERPELRAYQMLFCYLSLLTFAAIGLRISSTGRRSTFFFIVFWILMLFETMNRALLFFGQDSVLLFSIYGAPIVLFIELGIVALRVYYTLHPIQARRLTSSEMRSEKNDRASGSRNFPENMNELIRRLFDEEKIYLDEDLTPVRLAAMLGIKPYILADYFRVVIGQSFREYVNDRRLARARELLENSDMNVTRIAYECGFNSRSVFYRRFKESTGMHPADYRKRFRSAQGEDRILTSQSD